MAFRVPCSHCGPRPLEEFLYGDIPETPERLTEAAARDLDRVYMKTNPAGPSREAWFHAAGCRRWTHLVRDRTSDEWL